MFWTSLQGMKMKVAGLEVGGCQESSVHGPIICSMAKHRRVPNTNSLKSFNSQESHKQNQFGKYIWAEQCKWKMVAFEEGFINCPKLTVKEKNIACTIFSCYVKAMIRNKYFITMEKMEIGCRNNE